MIAALNDCLYKESLNGCSGVKFELTYTNMRVRDLVVLACQHVS
jgi:hypothetical protein